jgi:hypothetical protein
VNALTPLPLRAGALALAVLVLATVESGTGHARATRSRDRTPPTCAITAPVTAQGHAFRVIVRASDARGVAKVRLTVDGVPAGERTARPFQFDVSVKRFPARACATAVDRAGNVSKEACRDIGGPPPSESCRTNDDCESGAYCSKALGDCDGVGTCKPRPEACYKVYSPVCGCDGQTHGNSCDAASAGVSVGALGECRK